MVKNNDSMQQCSHGSATSEKNLLEIKRILTKILFVWLEICAQSPGVWISEPGHDLGGIAADVIFQQNTILIHWIFCQHSTCKYKVCKVCPWWVAVFYHDFVFICVTTICGRCSKLFLLQSPFRTIQRVWRRNIVQMYTACFSWEPK